MDCELACWLAMSLASSSMKCTAYNYLRGLTSSSTFEIVEELWQYVAASENTTSVRNYLFVVCWIYGVHNRQLIERVLSESTHVIFRKLQGQPSAGIDFPAEEQLKHVKNKLEQLYLNRLNSECLKYSDRQLLRSRSEHDLTFQPQLSDRTRRLALQHKTRPNQRLVDPH
jgi:hypothetical protein